MLINLLLIKRTKCSVSKRHSINVIVERHKNKSLRAFQDDDTREWQACDVAHSPRYKLQDSLRLWTQDMLQRFRNTNKGCRGLSWVVKILTNNKRIISSALLIFYLSLKNARVSFLVLRLKSLAK